VGAGGKEEEEDMAVDVIEEDGSDDHERMHAYGKRGCLSWLAPCPCYIGPMANKYTWRCTSLISKIPG
jgi:hypothetical protein